MRLWKLSAEGKPPETYNRRHWNRIRATEDYAKKHDLQSTTGFFDHLVKVEEVEEARGKGGRPSISGAGGKSPILRVVAPVEVAAQLQVEADAVAGGNLSEYLRRILENHVKESKMNEAALLSVAMRGAPRLLEDYPADWPRTITVGWGARGLGIVLTLAAGHSLSFETFIVDPNEGEAYPVYYREFPGSQKSQE